MKSLHPFLRLFVWMLLLIALRIQAADKKIVLIAGRQSHGPGDHEFRAGSLLLQKCLGQVAGIQTLVYSNGWPFKMEGDARVDDNSVFDGAAAVVIYADGGGGHPAIRGNHRQVLGDLAKKGVGLGFMHYGVEVPRTNGGPEFLEWVGGYYEDRFSVNPMWSPDFKEFPTHPITRGVKPFSNRDEWYFNIRFNPDLLSYQSSGTLDVKTAKFAPILVVKPPDEVRKGRYVSPPGPYPHVIEASGRQEIIMWALERPDGGRGFGFTGGHTHAHWSNDNQRKVVLNALLWIAKSDVPPNGVESTVSDEEMKQNLDPKQRRQ